jgi:hypothetical protein
MMPSSEKVGGAFQHVPRPAPGAIQYKSVSGKAGLPHASAMHEALLSYERFISRIIMRNSSLDRNPSISLRNASRMNTSRRTTSRTAVEPVLGYT